MYYNGKDVNLEEYVEARKKEYYDNLKTGSTDYWEDENLIWAIQNYQGCVGWEDFSDADRQWLKDNHLLEVIDIYD